MAKPADLGKVKTRLAADIGDTEALKVYQSLLNYTLKITAESRTELKTFFAWEPKEWEGSYQLQEGADLGEKMWNAFSETAKAGFRRMIMIGADCPDLTAAHIHETKELLETHDLVIGPSEDGGYYLIGINELYRDLFVDMPWSTEALMEATTSKAQELGLRYYFLEELNDIDTREDLEKSNFVSSWKG